MKGLERDEILSKVTKWASQMGLTVKSVTDPTVDFHMHATFNTRLHPIDELIYVEHTKT